MTRIYMSTDVELDHMITTQRIADGDLAALDFEPVCEMAECENPATHLFKSYHTSCYRDTLICLPCAEELVEAHRNLRGVSYKCPRCNKRLPVNPPVFRIEPLP